MTCWNTCPLCKQFEDYVEMISQRQQGVKRRLVDNEPGFQQDGISFAPKDFTKLLKPPLSYLRLQEVTVAIYIDDTYIQ